LRLSGAALPVVGALAMGTLAIVPGFACATPGHTGEVAASDGGGSGSSGGGSSGGGVDAGMTVTTTGPAQNTGLFAQTCTAGTTSVDWSPTRRISRVEYNNMVRDLLDDTTQPANTYGFPPETGLADGVNLNANTNAPPSNTAVEDYLLAAEGVALSAVSDTNRMNNTILAGIASCSQNHDDTCATDFINSWVNRAYRGQMDASESADLFTMYQTVKTQFDWTTGIQSIITAVLESPRFLYVLEFGAGNPTGTVIALSPYETAARLAFFLWRSVPDSTLMSAAAAGQLATPQDLKTQAARMLAVKDSNGNLLAQSALNDFTTQWMQLTPIQAKDPQFNMSFNGPNANGALGAAMDDEVRTDVSQTVLVDNGSLTDLLTSTSTYANKALASFYNYMQPVSGTAGGETAAVSDSALAGDTTFTKTQFPNRVGILTAGAVLATQSHSTLPSLVLRGKLVRENVLCDPIPPPPPGVPSPASMPPDAGTTRDLLLEHQQKGTTCPTCHQYMDTIGVGFGNFDATGLYQSTDANGFMGTFPPIDASGTIAADTLTDTNGFSATFSNATDMVTKLAGATQVRQCFTLQELRYALSRIETPSDACSAEQIYGAFTSANQNVQALIFAIVQSDAFRYRSVQTALSECKQ
jgi:hypothetical protein